MAQFVAKANRRSSRKSTSPRLERRKVFFESLEGRDLLATLYWQGDVSNAWSDVNNWTTNPAVDTLPAVAPVTGDTLNFDTTVVNFNTGAAQGYTPNNDIAGLSNLTINLNDTGASDFNLGGLAAGLSAAGVSSNVSNGAGATISMPVSVAASNFGNLGAPLTVSGVVSGTSLIQGGPGTLILSNANTHTGGTVINGGVLQITNATATGTNTTTVNAGVFEINNIAHNGALTLNNGATVRGLGTGASQAGAITVSSGAFGNFSTGAAGDVLTITSVFSNAAGSLTTPSMTILGPGIISVQGNSTAYRGFWLVQSGTMRVTSSGSFGEPDPAGALAGSHVGLTGGNLAILSNTGLNFNAGSGSAIGVTATVSSTITSQRTSAGAGVAHAFGSLTLAGVTLNMTYDNATVTSGDAAIDFNGLTGLLGNATINTIRPGSARILPRFNGGISDSGVARTLTFNNNGPSATEEAAVITGTSSLIAASQIAITGNQPFRLVLQGAAAGGNASLRQSNTAATVLDIRSDTNNATFNNNIILDSNTELRQSRINLGTGLTFNIGSITFNNPVTLTVNHNAPTTVTANTNYQFNTTGIVLGANAVINVNNNGTGSGTLNVTGAVSETGGARNLTKGGAGTLALNAAAGYTGTTAINNGRILLGANNAISNAPLTLGSGATVGSLDMATFSQNVTTLSALSNTNTLNNTILIGAGQTLNASGAVTVGLSVSGVNSNTRLTMSGSGSFVNTPGSGTFQVGGDATNTGQGNSATLDMSGLGTFTTSVATFRIGDNQGGTGTGASTVILANTSTITATTLTMQTGRSSLQTLRLGSGTNIINANTIQVGQVGGRASGLINFNSGTGTLTLRNTAGTGRAAVDVGWGTTGTDGAITSHVDFTGHNVDLLISNLNIAQRTASGATQTGGTIASFTFDSGILDVTAINMATKTGTTATNSIVGATLNIGGGTATIGSITTANNIYTTGTGNANSTININGGTTTVTGNLTLTTGTGTQTTTSVVNLNGGTLQVNGNIADGSVTTGASTFNFNNGILRAGANNANWIQNLTAANVQPGGAVIDSNGFSVTIAQPLLDAGGGLTKQGLGTLTLSGTNTYSGVTNVSAGTLALQNGAAISDTAGAVNVALGATLQLLASETVSAYSGAGDIGVGTNDSTLALGANTLTTTGNAAIANVTTTAGGGIVAGGSITDTDDDNNITGPNVYLQAATGIGTAIDPIETAVGSIQLNNTTSGVVNVLNSNAGALLTVADLRTLGFGAQNLGGALTVVNSSPLTIAANVIAAGAVVLTASDSAAVGDDLIVNPGVIIQSTGSTVTLNAGDIATIPATALVAAAGNVVINIDAGDLDPGVGGTLNFAADVDAPLAIFNGLTDANGDTFNVRPDQDTGDILTPIQVFGLTPNANPNGDALVLNISGLGIPTLTLGPGDRNGSFSFGALAAPLTYNNIENVSTNPALPYHLVLDMRFSGYENGAADTILARLDAAGTNLLLDVNAANVFTGPDAVIQSLTIIGSNDNDALTIQETAGGLPRFLGGAPVVNNTGVGGSTSNGSHLNNSADLTLETLIPGGTPWDATDVTMHFDGGAGTDSLAVNYTTANSTGYFSDTDDAGNSGNLSTSPGAFPALGTPTLLMSFANIEPLTLSGAGGLLLTDATGTGATSSLTLTDIGAATQIVGNNGFATTTFSGFNAAVVVGGGGAETLDVVSVDNATLTSLTLLGGNTNDLLALGGGDAAADTLRVRSLPATISATLNGNAGSDLFQLFDAANTTDNIAGNVTVDGTDGNVGGNTDTLTIVNTGGATADNAVIGAVNAGVSQDYFIDGITTAVSSDVTFRNIDVLNYTATGLSDTIDGRFVNTTPAHDLNTVNLSGWTGADQFLLLTSDQIGGSGPNNTPSGIASGLNAINLYGDFPGNPNGGDGNDTFGATPVGVVGTGATNVGLVVPDSTRMIRPSASTAINIDGGQPTGLAAPLGDVVGDVLNVDISALPNTTPVVVSTFAPGTVVAAGIQPLVWTQIEDINLVDQGKLTNVQMGDLFARTTPGADLVQITRNPTPLNPNQVRLRITATIGNYSASNKTLIYGGGGNDTITQSNLTIPAEFYGEAGDDYLSGAMNNDWLVGGDGNDRINGSGGDNVIWGDNAPTNPGDLTPQDSPTGGDDQLSGLGGNDVFYGSGGNDLVSAGGGNDYVNGGAGNDTLGGDDGDDRLYGGAGNDVMSGHAGNDLLSGGDGNDQLTGSTGNDVILAGTGADKLEGGDGNDLLVSGSVANENSTWTSVASTTTYSAATYTSGGDNDAALLTLLSQWGSASNRSSIAAITHDGANDDLAGGTGDDDFCWETADVLDNFPGVSPNDFNAPGMGTDERFGPT